MVIRVVRVVVGALLLLVGLPLLLAGGVLWFAMQHQDPAGGYKASLATITSEGYAVVASDVDALLRREAPFARGGQTSLRLTARTDIGPAFLGLAPATDVARYLAGVPYLQVNQVRMARGTLPVSVSTTAGAGFAPAVPEDQSFWLAGSGVGALEWRPYELRGEQLALVVMDPAARAPLTVDVTAHVQPEWVGTTTVGLLVLGTILVLIAVAALAWPGRSREIIYVVPPAQVPEIVAHLGVTGPSEPVPVTPLAPEPRAPEPEPAEVSAPEPDPPDPAEPAAVPVSAEVGAPRAAPPPYLEWPPPAPRQ
jgi:hypothetical protein